MFRQQLWINAAKLWIDQILINKSCVVFWWVSTKSEKSSTISVAREKLTRRFCWGICIMDKIMSISNRCRIVASWTHLIIYPLIKRNRMYAQRINNLAKHYAYITWSSKTFQSFQKTKKVLKYSDFCCSLFQKANNHNFGNILKPIVSWTKVEVC